MRSGTLVRYVTLQFITVQGLYDINGSQMAEKSSDVKLPIHTSNCSLSLNNENITEGKNVIRLSGASCSKHC